MSLGRLLTAGKSLTTLRNTPTAYRVNERALLPKFGAAENPFAAEWQQDLTSSSAGTQAVSAAQAEGSQKSAQRERMASAESGAKPGVRSTPATGALASIWPWKWLRRVKPPSSLARRKPANALMAAVGSKRPVQGELSLDKVKVVCNDLSGSDFVVVPAGQSGNTGLRPRAAKVLAGAMMAERALDRLAERIVGAGPG